MRISMLAYQFTIPFHDTISRYHFTTPVNYPTLHTQYRVRFSRLASKKLLKRVTVNFRKWVHEDEDSRVDKLRLLRSLEPNDEDDNDMVETVYVYLAEALVDYARGMPNIQSVKPFGLKASRSTIAFKKLSSPVLAITVAALYQIVRTLPHKLDQFMKQTRPPISAPWPRAMISRYVSLQKAFAHNRAAIFEAYERDGGKYLGDEPAKKATKKRKREITNMSEFEEDF